MKLIREGRFGAPKTWKTGSIVGTYPRPLLVLLFDESGLSVIEEPVSLHEYDKLPLEVNDGIHAVDFTVAIKRHVPLTYTRVQDPAGYTQFLHVVNQIVTKPNKWATVVVDSASTLGDAIHGHMAAVNMLAFNDARVWAGDTSVKIHQIITALSGLKSHLVFIFHEDLEKNELTGEIRFYPLTYGKLRYRASQIFSQFFYQTIEEKKPVIYTTDRGYVKGIGARWPKALPPVCGPTFDAIYGAYFKAQQQ